MSILGGSQSSETKIPAYLEDQSKYVLDRGNATSRIGYTPYYGPDVAALSPLEEAAMRNTSSAANAFGLFSPQSDPLAQINGTTAPVDPASTANPEAAQVIQQAYRDQLGRDPDQAGFDFWMKNYNPQTFQNDFAQGVRMDPLTGLSMPGTFNGTRGYSSAPMFQGAVDRLQQNRPGQFEALLAQFINPQTGQAPQHDRNMQQQAAMGVPPQMMMPDYGGRGDAGYGGSRGGGAIGGYSGFGDLFDGGGPGRSGGQFGGLFGGVSNALGKEPGKGFFGGLFG